MFNVSPSVAILPSVSCVALFKSALFLHIFDSTLKMDAIFLLSLVQFCGMFQMSHGQLFGLMLNNPLALTSLDPHSKLNHRGLTHEDREMNEQPDSAHRGAIRSGVDTVLIRCKQDSDCIDDDDNISGHPENLMYCDRHYGFCDFFRQVGELCRHDSQCDSGLICMFGKCAQPFAAGERGSRCLNGNDCASGLCCARQHGERICKVRSIAIK